MKSEIENNIDLSEIKVGTLLESIEDDSRVVLVVTRKVSRCVYETVCLYTEGSSGWDLYEVADQTYIDNANDIKWKVFTGTIKLRNDL